MVLVSAFFIYTSLTDDTSDLIAVEGKYELPDGSIAFLHKGATIDLDFSEKERKVVLTGKAHFDVVRNESLPFIVSTKDTEVEVLEPHSL